MLRNTWTGGMGEWDVLVPCRCYLQLHLPASCICVSKIPGLLSFTPSGFEATPQAGKFVRSFGWALWSAFDLQVFTWGSLLQGTNSATLAVIKQSLISQSICYLSGSQFGPQLPTEIRYHLHYTEIFINIREIHSVWHLHVLPLTNQWMNSCIGAGETEEETLEFHPCQHNQSTICPVLMLLCLCTHINILTYFTIGYYYWLYNSMNMSSLQNTWLVVFTINESFKLCRAYTHIQYNIYIAEFTYISRKYVYNIYIIFYLYFFHFIWSQEKCVSTVFIRKGNTFQMYIFK